MTTRSIKTFPDLIACEHCDRVYQRADLAPHEVARCEGCEAVLYRAERFNIDQWLALTLTAAIVFILANTYPVIRISMQGQHNEATLWQSVEALGRGPTALIAVPAALTVIVVPFLQIALLGWVLIHARLGLRSPGFALSMRALSALRPWGMVEVCLVGTLVAIVKLSSYLSVVGGPGIWATATLTVLLVIIANRDTHWLWDISARELP
ncbi:paraquat-inducible protein A [Chitinimonas naiadis]